MKISITQATQRDRVSEREGCIYSDMHKKALNCKWNTWATCQGFLFLPESNRFISRHNKLRRDNAAYEQCVSQSCSLSPSLSHTLASWLQSKFLLSSHSVAHSISLSLFRAKHSNSKLQHFGRKASEENYKKTERKLVKLCYLKAQNATQCSSGQYEGGQRGGRVGRGSGVRASRQSNCEQTN